MTHALICLFMALSAPPVQVWTESSLADVGYGCEPGPKAGAFARIYCAPGEMEALQVCIRSQRHDLPGVTMRAETISPELPQPDIFVVASLITGAPPGSEDAMQAIPDPLIRLESAVATADQTLAFWVRYAINEDTRPGIYRQNLRLSSADGWKGMVEVTVEVFGFALPHIPSLRSLAPLDREGIQLSLCIDDADLALWRPVYDSLAGSRIAPAIWRSGAMMRVARDGTVDTTCFKEHLSYAVEKLGMSAICLSDNLMGVSDFPAVNDFHEPDLLESYLLGMDEWLTQQGWIERAVTLPMLSPPRGDWQQARDVYFRLYRADRRIKRIIATMPSPFLERYSDIIAAPLSAYDPMAWPRLRQGYSLAAKPAVAAEDIAASSSGDMDKEPSVHTRAEDAYDGSLFTAWCSSGEGEKVEWIEVRFAEPIQTDHFRVAWASGFEPADIRVRTSHTGDFFGEASVKWRRHATQLPFEAPWSEGRFTLRRNLRAIRFEFPPKDGMAQRVAIAEMEFGAPPAPESVERIKPVEIWLYPTSGQFPSTAPGRPAIEPRAIAWVCWGHGYDGVLFRSLNDWPSAWRYFGANPPMRWMIAHGQEAPLFYPGATGLSPSIRSERIRDGFEDFEYLQAAAAAQLEGLLNEDEANELALRRIFLEKITSEDLAAFSKDILDRRLRIGRLLSLRLSQRKLAGG